MQVMERSPTGSFTDLHKPPKTRIKYLTFFRMYMRLHNLLIVPSELISQKCSFIQILSLFRTQGISRPTILVITLLKAFGRVFA